MPFSEVREHAPGRLHRLFAERYSAFDNRVSERRLHRRVALRGLLQPDSPEGDGANFHEDDAYCWAEQRRGTKFD